MMRQAGTFIRLTNLYEWLPPQGELRTVLRLEGSELIVEVFYENDADQTETSKSIVFTGVCSFHVAAVPGVNLVAIDYVDKIAIDGSLVEYPNSLAAKAWSDYFQYRKVRHFQLCFLYTNQRLEIFADKYELL